MAELSAIGIVDKFVASLASIAGASKFLKVDTIINDLVAGTERIVLILSAVGILNTDSQRVRHPSIIARYAFLSNVVECQAGEARTGYNCAAA